MDVRKGRHVVYALHEHFVFVTKDRREALSSLAIADLKRLFSTVCKNLEAELAECDGEDNRMFLTVIDPPTLALSHLAQALRGVSSSDLREWRLAISGRYRKGVLRSPTSFVASCGGATLSIIAKYTRSQWKTALLGGLEFLPGLKSEVSHEVF